MDGQTGYVLTGTNSNVTGSKYKAFTDASVNYVATSYGNYRNHKNPFTVSASDTESSELCLTRHGRDVIASDASEDALSLFFVMWTIPLEADLGQSFTLPYAVSASSSFFISVCAAPIINDTTTCYIYAVDGSGFPTGSYLYASEPARETLFPTLVDLSVSAVCNHITYYFPTAVTLAASTQYAFVITVPNGTWGYRNVVLAERTINPYSGGAGCKSINGAPWEVLSPAGDLIFTIGNNNITTGTYTSNALVTYYLPNSLLLFFANYRKEVNTLLKFFLTYSDNAVDYYDYGFVKNGEVISIHHMYWKVRVDFTGSNDYINTPYLWNCGFIHNYSNALELTDDPDGATDTLPIITSLTNPESEIDIKDYDLNATKFNLTCLPHQKVIAFFSREYWTNAIAIWFKKYNVGNITKLKQYCGGPIEGYNITNKSICINIGDALSFFDESIPTIDTTGGGYSDSNMGRATNIYYPNKTHAVDILVDIITNAMSMYSAYSGYYIDQDSFDSLKAAYPTYYAKIGAENIFVTAINNGAQTGNTIIFDSASDLWSLISNSDDVLGGLKVVYNISGNEYIINDYNSSTYTIYLSTDLLSVDTTASLGFKVKDYDTRIKEKTGIKGIVKDLCMILNAFIIPVNNKIKIISYDASATSQYTLTNKDIISITTDMSINDIINECWIYYMWDGEGSDKDNYKIAYRKLDTSCQFLQRRNLIQELQLKYLCDPDSLHKGTTNATTLSTAIVTNRRYGQLRVEIETSLNYDDIELGDYVTITHENIVALNKSNSLKCFVTSKKYNNNTLSFKLVGT